MTLTPEGYRQRLIDGVLERGLRLFGAVHLTGPKYCGKTWAAMNQSNSMLKLDDPSDEYAGRRFAMSRPVESLEGDQPRLMDEWQVVPPLWDATRIFVDKSGRKGQIILCGSSVLEKSVTDDMHTGFGRISSIRMHTMSLFETGDSDGSISLGGLFDSKFEGTDWKSVGYEDLAGFICRGGWPDNLGMSVADSEFFCRNLMESILFSDVPRIAPGANPLIVRSLLRSLARNESSLATDKRIRSDVRRSDDDNPIEQNTLIKYMGILERLFLIDDQPAYDPNVRSSKRVIKSSKRHLSDPSLAVAALGISQKSLVDDTETFGLLFEALCEHDLRIYAEVNGGKLFHYRDGDGREIDAVVEMPDGRWGAFEIKLSRAGIDDAIRSLDRAIAYISKQPNARPPEFRCILCGAAEAAERLPDGTYLVPITRLRD